MKKTFALLLMMILTVTLCACGKDKVTTLSCSGEQSGSKMTFDLSATNDTIDKVKMTVVPNNADMQITSFKDLDEATKTQIKDLFLTNLGLEKESYEGLDVIVNFDDNMNIIIDADLKTADKTILTKLGLDFDDKDMSLKRAKEDFESTGFTCK